MKDTNNYDKELWESWHRTKSEKVANDLICRYMPVVQYQVQRFAFSLPNSIPVEEIKSLALMGLYDAIEKFDYTRELKFETYASIRIRGAIIDGLRKEDFLSRGLREKIKKMESVSEKLEQRLLRTPTIEEISREMNVAESEVYALMAEQVTTNLIFIDESIHEENDSRLLLIENANSVNPETAIENNERNRELEEAIKKSLNGKEQMVVTLYYLEELTFTEIGTVLGITTSRVSQIHSKALVKLKNALEGMV